jgi:hypothetical protein
LQWRGAWSAEVNYAIDDAVQYASNAYVAIQPSTDFIPNIQPEFWSLLASGIVWRGDWEDATDYNASDAVRRNGSAYIALEASTGQDPATSGFWSLLVQKADKGDKGDKGDQGAQGVAGAKGDQGPQGVAGAKGDKGDQGSQGAAGAAGAKGDKGDQGPQGTAGADGATGAQGATGPAGTTGQVGYVVFGTTALPLAGVDFVSVPGLSVTISVPANAFVLINSTGGIQTSSAVSTGFSSIDVALGVDGLLPTNGSHHRVIAANTAGVPNNIVYWSLSTLAPLTQGNHTIAVFAKNNGGGSSAATVSGDSNSIFQGTLNVAILKQ